MSSSNGRDKSGRATKAEAALSPADRFNIDREGPARRAGKLQDWQQHFRKLDQHCEAAVAEIRASLERPSR